MEGGEISGNTAQSGSWANGGGVWVEGEDALFTMKSGTIFGNTANQAGGVKAGSTFTMSGGRIQGSTDSDGFTKNTGTAN
jgi:hypothetical protein